jgi:hypothetical protein
MKLTRNQLRKLIREAVKQKVPLFDPVSQREIDAMRHAGRQYADTSSLDASQSAKLAGLATDEPNVERSIYQALGSEEPATTVEEEEAFLAGQDVYLQDMSDFNLHQVLEDIFVNGNRDENLLRKLGFVKNSDFPHLQPGAEEYEEYYKEQFKEQAELLGKAVNDLMSLDSDEHNEMYDAITDFLIEDKRIKSLDWNSNYAGVTVIFYPLALKNTKKMILVDHHHGGWAVITI